MNDSLCPVCGAPGFGEGSACARCGRVARVAALPSRKGGNGDKIVVGVVFGLLGGAVAWVASVFVWGFGSSHGCVGTRLVGVGIVLACVAVGVFGVRLAKHRKPARGIALLVGASVLLLPTTPCAISTFASPGCTLFGA